MAINAHHIENYLNDKNGKCYKKLKKKSLIILKFFYVSLKLFAVLKLSVLQWPIRNLTHLKKRF